MSALLNAFLGDESTTIEDLEKAIPVIQKEIEKRNAAKLDEARNKLREYAKELKVPLELLLEEPKGAKAERKPVEPRYRNKNNHAETWTGRGKQPKWLVTELEKGAKLEDFLI